jgi:hypothetical protein
VDAQARASLITSIRKKERDTQATKIALSNFVPCVSRP